MLKDLGVVVLEVLAQGRYQGRQGALDLRRAHRHVVRDTAEMTQAARVVVPVDVSEQEPLLLMLLLQPSPQLLLPSLAPGTAAPQPAPSPARRVGPFQRRKRRRRRHDAEVVVVVIVVEGVPDVVDRGRGAVKVPRPSWLPVINYVSLFTDRAAL